MPGHAKGWVATHAHMYDVVKDWHSFDI